MQVAAPVLRVATMSPCPGSGSGHGLQHGLSGLQGSGSVLALRGSARQLTARCHRPATSVPVPLHAATVPVPLHIAAGSRFPRPGRSMLQCLLSFLLVVCIPYITCKPRVMESQARLEGQLNGSRQQQRSSSNGSVIDRRTVQRYAAVGRQYIDSSMHARVPITVLAHYLPITCP